MNETLIAIDIETTGLLPSQHQLMSLSMVEIPSEYIEKISKLEPSNMYVGIDLKEVRKLTKEIRSLDFTREVTFYYSHSNYNWQDKAYEYFDNYSKDWEMHCKPLNNEGFDAWLNDYEKVTFVGHNVAFDLSFINEWCQNNPKINYHSIDTRTILKFMFYQDLIGEESQKKPFKCFVIDDVSRHTSLADARCAAKLFLMLMLENKTLSGLYY